MITSVLIFLVLSLAFAGVNYLVTSNLITTIIVFAISSIYLIAVDATLIKKYKLRFKHFNQNYTFINTFIIALSVKENVGASFQLAYDSMNEEFKDDIKGLAQLDSYEKLKYLERYFQFDSYSLLMKLVDIYQERGGDILVMSKYLINEIRNEYNYLSSVESIRVRKYVEVGVLWLLTVVILVVLRFSLTNFADKIVNQEFFYIGVLILFIFIVFAIDYLIRKSIKVDIKGWNKYENKK